ncbi:MAG: immunoglobulin domain-containing protein [Verrucomicrobiales bacterium]|nr:immunoglobulin domain-containing protein [Verrucomicrobiales bacterium]
MGEYSPVILREPQSQTVFQGQTARLGVEARGVGELAYQWYFEGAVLPGLPRRCSNLRTFSPSGPAAIT